MDDLSLAKRLLGKNNTIEEKSEKVNPSSASIVYMVAVTSSSGGEVVLKDEINSEADWQDGDYVEIDEDGHFEEFESDDDPLEDIDDSIVDMTDGDGANIEDTETESVAFTVSQYQAAAMAAYAEASEAEGSEDSLPDENASIDSTIDDGDATVLPDVGEVDEDALAGEDSSISEITDAEYTLTDDNSDDESDEPISGAEISDGYTVAECVGAINEGDRVAVLVQNGQMVVLGVAGSGDEQLALLGNAAEAADEATAAAESAQANANAANEAAAAAQTSANEANANASTAAAQAADAASKATAASNEAAEAAQRAADAAAKADQVELNLTEVNTEISNVKSDAVKLREDMESGIETVTQTMTADYAKKTDVSETESTLRSEMQSSVAGLQQTFEQDYAKKTELDDAVVEVEEKLQTQITQNANEISSTAKAVEDINVEITDQNGKIANAISTAADAQTVANNAATDATEAKTAAAAAQTNAAAANTAAAAAQTNADNAKAQAEAAQTAANAAKTDLATAQAKPAEVEGTIGAAQEDIEEARQAVTTAKAAADAAQAAADTAKSTATTAQNTADTAKANAAAASTAAANAQSSADAAATAASNAQKAADEAKADLAALDARVKTAETNITQNAEQIELRATKKELQAVSNDLSTNYYTKEQTEAKLKIESDKIASVVSTTNELGQKVSTLEQTSSGFSLRLDTVESDAIVSTQEQFYQSESPTALTGGTWSNTQPEWAEGKYIWRRTLVTYGNGNTSYTPDETGVCITGNNGATGAAGKDAITMSITSSKGTVLKNDTDSTELTAHVYLGGVEKVIATNGTVADGLGTVKWYKGDTLIAAKKSHTVSGLANVAEYKCVLDG